MKFIILLVLTILSGPINCSKVLVLFPGPSPSHYFLGNALARGLTEAGHDVTIVSPFTDKDPPKNGSYREVILTGVLEEFRKQLRTNLFDMENMNPFPSIVIHNYLGMGILNRTLTHHNFQNLIKSGEQFDVVILEQFLNDGLKAVAHYYNAPLILLSVGGANTWINPLVGNPSPPSYISETRLGYPISMSFWQRLNNFVYRALLLLNHHFLFIPMQDELMKQHFPDAPDLRELIYNASLVFLTSHESTNQPVPYVPNMINIGGFHVKPTKKLSEDLREFMDNAKEGVVYFSMGSNIKPSQMPPDKREAILKALGKIKQKVLWKWDEDTLPGKPDNVKLSKWFPQQEILAHPNTKLFITHGGLLSITESVYHGVPVLTFPIFADQKVNAALIERNGIGITLPFSQITEQKLSNALDILLSDPKYPNTAKMRSNLMHDRPIKPLDLAVYWVEYIIRHKGAPHLRVAALDLSWYEYLLLDVLAFIGLLSISSILITYVIIRRIFCTSKVSKIKIKTS